MAWDDVVDNHTVSFNNLQRTRNILKKSSKIFFY